MFKIRSYAFANGFDDKYSALYAEKLKNPEEILSKENKYLNEFTAATIGQTSYYVVGELLNMFGLKHTWAVFEEETGFKMDEKIKNCAVKDSISALEGLKQCPQNPIMIYLLRWYFVEKEGANSCKDDLPKKMSQSLKCIQEYSKDSQKKCTNQAQKSPPSEKDSSVSDKEKNDQVKDLSNTLEKQQKDLRRIIRENTISMQKDLDGLMDLPNSDSHKRSLIPRWVREKTVKDNSDLRKAAIFNHQKRASTSPFSKFKQQKDRISPCKTCLPAGEGSSRQNCGPQNVEARLKYRKDRVAGIARVDTPFYPLTARQKRKRCSSIISKQCPLNAERTNEERDCEVPENLNVPPACPARCIKPSRIPCRRAISADAAACVKDPEVPKDTEESEESESKDGEIEECAIPIAGENNCGCGETVESAIRDLMDMLMETVILNEDDLCTDDEDVRNKTLEDLLNETESPSWILNRGFRDENADETHYESALDFSSQLLEDVEDEALDHECTCQHLQQEKEEEEEEEHFEDPQCVLQEILNSTESPRWAQRKTPVVQCCEEPVAEEEEEETGECALQEVLNSTQSPAWLENRGPTEQPKGDTPKRVADHFDDSPLWVRRRLAKQFVEPKKESPKSPISHRTPKQLKRFNKRYRPTITRRKLFSNPMNSIVEDHDESTYHTPEVTVSSRTCPSSCAVRACPLSGSAEEGTPKSSRAPDS